MENFGVIVACYRGDYSFTKGCCASIRYFLGDVPICLIVDGTFSTRDLENAYGVSVINHQTVQHAILREKSFGWGLTKMVAFWESPWKNFFYLDADTVVWGNVLKFANFDDFDLIIDQPRYAYPDAEVCKWFFDGNRLESRFPGFQWRDRPYFCSGTFFAKRDVFPLEEYLEFLELQAAEPDLFYPGEQGFLNFMIFRAADQGRIRLDQKDFQLIVPDFTPEQLAKQFPIGKDGPVCDDYATVIHWSGRKPFLSRSEVYSEPMNFFRRQAIKDTQNYTGVVAEARLQMEDFSIYKRKILRRVL